MEKLRFHTYIPDIVGLNTHMQTKAVGRIGDTVRLNINIQTKAVGRENISKLS